MKKIAVFHPSAELYGADRIMVLSTRALKEYTPIIYLPVNGPLVEFIAKELPQAEVKIIENMPVISRALFSPKGIVSVTKKYLWFKRFVQAEHMVENFDRIYVNTLACSSFLPALSHLNVPIFTHVHEILERPKIVAKITARLAFKYSDTVISVSKAVQSNLHRLCKNRKGKSIIVHNGIHPIVCPILEKDKHLSFYLFGRIKPEKGQWYLIDALAQIPKAELKGVRFNLVGGVLKGKEFLMDNLLEKIKANGLEEYIIIKGFSKDISGEMSKADVCLIPSLMKDPFPTTVLEAMSAGKAIITSDTGGAKEAIQHMYNGFVIPSDQPVVFANIIRKLISDRALIHSIGKNARASFNSNFTTEHFNERWLAALNVA